MSEKYYVVSESELEALRHAAFYAQTMKALDACHARPVPEWATHFYSFELNDCVEPLRRFMEIKR